MKQMDLFEFILVVLACAFLLVFILWIYYGTKKEIKDEKEFKEELLKKVIDVNDIKITELIQKSTYIYGLNTDKIYSILNRKFQNTKKSTFDLLYFTNDNHKSTIDAITQKIKTNNNRKKVLVIDDYALSDDYIYENILEILKISRGYNCTLIISSTSSFDKEIYNNCSATIISTPLEEDLYTDNQILISINNAFEKGLISTEDQTEKAIYI